MMSCFVVDTYKVEEPHQQIIKSAKMTTMIETIINND